MVFFDHLVYAFWLIFILYWLISAIGVKKNIHNSEWRRNSAFRILLVVIIIAVLQWNPFWSILEYQLNQNLQAIGVVLCVVGMAFAVWARWHLGKNWSGTPSIKEGHELITSGPYHFVRHPIYTGMLLALIGSALTLGLLWFLILIIFSANFFYRIPLEERYMMQLFPDQYPEYKKRTKRLIPFLW